MKKLILALILAASGSAFANKCGFPPFPPFGTYPVCVCDKMGNNCHWIFVSKQ